MKLGLSQIQNAKFLSHKPKGHWRTLSTLALAIPIVSALCLGMGGCTDDEDPKAERLPSLTLNAQPGQPNMAEGGESLLRVTGNHLPPNMAVRIHVLDDPAEAQRMGYSGEVTGKGVITQCAGAEASSDRQCDLTMTGDIQADTAVFLCEEEGKIPLVVGQISGDDGQEPVSSAFVAIECINRDSSRFQISLEPRQRLLDVSNSTSVDLSVDDGAGGRHLNGQNLFLVADAGRFHNDNLSLTARITDSRVDNVTYFCPPVPRWVTLTASFSDPRDGINTATARIQCKLGEDGEEGIHFEFIDSEFAAAPRLLADGEDRTAITARVVGPFGPVGRQDDGETPITVAVQVDFGTLMSTDGEQDQYLDLETDSEGKVRFEVIAGLDPRIIVLRAKADLVGEEYPDGQMTLRGQKEIAVVGPGSVIFLQALPIPLGVRGSGYNPSSQISFQLFDSTGEPFPAGHQVEFELLNNAGGATLATGTALTDIEGVVFTQLNSGTQATVVTVRARMKVGRTETHGDSAAIPIIGVRPSARGFDIKCDMHNVGALIDNDGISSMVQAEIPCMVHLKDRFGNPVGLSTAVSFRSEAGSITASVNTIPYNMNADPTVPQPDVGKATAIFNTFGRLPRDVEPMVGEPRYPEQCPPHEPNCRIYNPRDGLVTIIAFTNGEEEFVDLNGNGVYDMGEPFVDLTEPCLDSNDNGRCDLDEVFIDLDRGDGFNGVWDGPNGQWDENTTIWTQTNILYTGSPVSFHSGWEQDSFNIPAGGLRMLSAQVKDQNLNCLNASARYIISSSAGRLFEASSSTYADSRCFRWSRRLEMVDDDRSEIRIDIGGWNARQMCGGTLSGHQHCALLGAASDVPPGEPTLTILRLDVSYRVHPDCDECPFIWHTPLTGVVY